MSRNNRNCALSSARKIHENLSRWGWSREETEADRQEAIESKFGRVKLLLKSTGLYSEQFDSFNGCWRWLFTFREVVVLAIGGYGAVGMSFMLLTTDEYNEKTSHEILICNWSWQEFFSCLFLIYWQRKGYIKDLFERVHWPSTSTRYADTRKAINGVLIGTAVSLFMVLCVMAAFLILYSTDSLMDVRIDISKWNIYGHPMVFLFFGVYTFYVFIVMLSFYIIISVAVHHELVKFNQELAQLGGPQGSNQALEDQMLNFYIKHVHLTGVVRSVDNFFEVYTFVLIGLNIPLTVFSVMNLVDSFHSFLDFAVNIAPTFFCVMELVGLTVVPAKLHEAIRQGEGIVYSNERIWHPYNERLYLIANTFVSHVKQSNCGISLWGFALLSKSTILTTISVTITFMTFFLQARSSNGMGAKPPFNETVSPMPFSV